MLYFAYGMNTNLLEMQWRCPDARSLGAAELIDHAFRFAVHADVVPCPGQRVDGVLWDITDRCLEALDALEGLGHYYDRSWQTVAWMGQRYPALVYHMIPGQPDSPPSDTYYETVREGYLEHLVPMHQLENINFRAFIS